MAATASTQTFTGQNTFTKLVTFSSSVYANNGISAGSIDVRGSAIFDDATSTTVFSGWGDFGMVIVSTYSASSSMMRVACPDNKSPITCGCNRAIKYLYVSNETDTDNTSLGTMLSGGNRGHSCTCGADDVGAMQVQAVCARIK